MGMELRREKGRDFFPTTDTEGRDLTTSPIPTSSSSSSAKEHSSSKESPSKEHSLKKHFSNQEESSRTPPYHYFGLYIGPSGDSLAPHTYMCIAMRCLLNDLDQKMNIKKEGQVTCTYTCIHIHIHAFASLPLLLPT
jgi:hypothetical protein